MNKGNFFGVNGIINTNYSFHKKGNRITANTIIKTSSPSNINNNPDQPSCMTAASEVMLSLLNIINKGTAMGKPNIAINAAFWRACAAMADKKVNSNDKLMPPTQEIMMNLSGLIKGAPNNKLNNARLRSVMTNIMITL